MAALNLCVAWWLLKHKRALVRRLLQGYIDDDDGTDDADTAGGLRCTASWSNAASMTVSMISPPNRFTQGKRAVCCDASTSFSRAPNGWGRDGRSRMLLWHSQTSQDDSQVFGLCNRSWSRRL